ncbi:MAG: helix-turn-helix domain-containing protein [Syntrophobacterales bacterium]|jgi:predicted transcriptional regulator
MSKRDEMEERCLEVKELQVLGMKVPQIAQIYGVTERSIWNYLRRARELFSRAAKNLNHDEILGETVKTLERIRIMAMRHFHLCEENNAVKVGYLNAALRATEKLVQLYQEVGVLVKVPERLAVEEGLPFEDEEIRKKYLTLLKEARAKKEKNLGL